jgi:hypothetical protein
VCYDTPCTRQPKVTNLEGTVRVDQQVAGLEVPMQHVGAVHILEPTQHLQRDSVDGTHVLVLSQTLI